MWTPRVFGKRSLHVILPLISGRVRFQNGWGQASAGGICSSRGRLLGSRGPGPCGRSPRWHSAWGLPLMGYQYSGYLQTLGPGPASVRKVKEARRGKGPTLGSVGAGLRFTRECVSVGEHFI